MVTLAKSGGGCLPRHRLDNAHTKFLVIDSLAVFVRRLYKQEYLFNISNMAYSTHIHVYHWELKPSRYKGDTYFKKGSRMPQLRT
jgi:hypothetical protein